MKIGLFPFLLGLSVFISVYRGFPSCPPAILVSEFRAQFFSEIQDSPSPLPLSLSPYVDPFVELAAADLLQQVPGLLELGLGGDLDQPKDLVREVHVGHHVIDRLRHRLHHPVFAGHLEMRARLDQNLVDHVHCIFGVYAQFVRHLKFPLNFQCCFFQQQQLHI